MTTRKTYNSKANRLSEAIEQQIDAGDFEVGQMLPAERILGEEHHVSRITIRRALDMLAEKGIVERLPHRGVVVRATPSGRYPIPQDPGHQQAPRPTSAAKAAVRLQIGVMRPAMPDAVLNRILDGINDFANEIDAAVHLLPHWQDENDAETIAAGAELLRLCGVIALPYRSSRYVESVRQVGERGVDVIGFDSHPSANTLAAIESDDAAGMYRAVNHLLATYRQPVWYLGRQAVTATESSRYDGYRCAMRDAGFADRVDAYTMVDVMASEDESGHDIGVRLGQRILRESTGGSISVACMRDDLAVGLYEVAHDHGMNIGPAGELRITGYGDLTIAGLLEPGLSTLAPPYREMGYQAARLLDAHHSKKPLPAKLVLRLPVTFRPSASA